MEVFVVILLAFALLILPIILSLVAFFRVQSIMDRLRILEVHVARLAAPAAPPPTAAAAPGPNPEVVIAPVAPAPVPRPPPAPMPAPKPAPPAPSKPSLELVIGGKLASFIGIAVLVTGVVLFVGYAIQRDWIGPGLRVILGLITGVVLAALGFAAERRDRKYAVLARALTGGGAALFYFSVFAAYQIYGLISFALALLGLVFSAGMALALAAFYDSQAVAVLGVLGAFLAPPLIGSRYEVGNFPMIFAAVVNVPVLLLGLRRKWQWLYNLAFVFTVGLAGAWLDHKLPGVESGAWRAALFFVVLFHAEFAGLGLLRLKTSPESENRPLDQARLGLSILALLGALHWIFEPGALHPWIGLVYALAAALHAGLARLAWAGRPQRRQEVMTFWVGAIAFASFAVPVQYDGVWVSLGWAIEGAALAWFALRASSDLLQAIALGLGLLGLSKSVLFDHTLYASAPAVFLNGRFITGMLASGLLGLQGWLHGRASSPRASDRSQILVSLSVLAALAVLCADVFFTLNENLPWPWLISTAALFVAGVGLIFLSPRASLPGALGAFLLLIVPVKVLWDTASSWDRYRGDFPLFLNLVLIAQLLLLAGVNVLRGGLERQLPARNGRPPLAGAINILSLASAILLVTLEFQRADFAWARPAITLWWAACAMALAVAGILRRRPAHRYLALVVFCAAVIKVYFVDLSVLQGLERVAAFIGVGLLLLVLSYVYQRLAPLWSSRESGPDR